MIHLAAPEMVPAVLGSAGTFALGASAEEAVEAGIDTPSSNGPGNGATGSLLVS